MRVTPDQIIAMKQRGERIPMLTAYDYAMAAILDAAGIPMLLVGDSLGMVMLGYETTLPVTLDDIIHHTRAVVRGAKRALIVADMPFMSFQISREIALQSAGRLMKEGGAQAVKLEGGRRVAESIHAIVEAGIPVMGHLGMTPQSVNVFGGFKVQGRTEAAARAMIEDALALEQAGVFAIVLELVPTPLAALITQRISVPTIGIGAGPYCDGEVQVIHDLLGLFPDFTPRHTRRFAEVGKEIQDAVQSYIAEVRARIFPTEKQGSTMDMAIIERLRQEFF
jgi:3-methyl-2-oxobutanoate hydroxymethyltransferase